MNRQQRRAAKAEDLATGIRVVAEEAAGVMDLAVVRPEEALDLFMASASGNREAIQLARCVASTVARVEEAGDGDAAVLCGCCDNRLAGTPFSVVVATPHRSDPSRAIGVGLCTDCTTKPAELGAKALEAMRRIFPDARPIALQGHRGGRA